MIRKLTFSVRDTLQGSLIMIALASSIVFDRVPDYQTISLVVGGISAIALVYVMFFHTWKEIEDEN